MLSWLMIVAKGTKRDDLDGAITAKHTAVVRQLGTVTWDGQRASIRTESGDMLTVTPGHCLNTEGGSVALIEGQIESPPPPQRPKLRLPGSGIPSAVLLVQDGTYRGCFFALGAEPCWLGQGASVHVDTQNTVILTTGSTSLTVSGLPIGADMKHLMTDGDVVAVGERKYQLLVLPKGNDSV
jgi:hypothetical protein